MYYVTMFDCNALDEIDWYESVWRAVNCSPQTDWVSDFTENRFLNVINVTPHTTKWVTWQILVNWVEIELISCFNLPLAWSELIEIWQVVVMVWWHPPIVIKVLWRKFRPLEQRKSNCFFMEEGMPISINIIACLECSCHIWLPQLVYFDKIHHVLSILKKIFMADVRRWRHRVMSLQVLYSVWSIFWAGR
jgi:hypothetical protein